MRDDRKRIKNLQGCISDLTSLLTLPLLWDDNDAESILGTLLDVLVHMLCLEFAYARTNHPSDSLLIEVCRTVSGPPAKDKQHNIVDSLVPWLDDDEAEASSISVLRNLAGYDKLTAMHIQLGLTQQCGDIVIASALTGFPTDIEQLLFKTAVNQLVIELQRHEVSVAHKQTALAEHKKNLVLAENNYLRQQLDRQEENDGIIGLSPALKKVMAQVSQVASTNACVLVQGETGTGKELIARALHRMSARNKYPFVKLNCAAIPEGLLEAELFGHEKGAFTGASAQQIGRFEMAHQGTLLLDEIGEIPLQLQAKLLRVLQEQEFERLGSSRTIHIDVRFIAATNRDLQVMLEQGDFREDLFYRLNVFPILLPPLRERKADIPLLVRYFIDKLAAEYNKSVSAIPKHTMAVFCSYHWPGNIRELSNVIERGIILSTGETFEYPLAELKTEVQSASSELSLIDFERQHILRALNDCGWIISGPSGAAQKLGMKRTSLQYKMKKLNIVRRR